MICLNSAGGPARTGVMPGASGDAGGSRSPRWGGGRARLVSGESFVHRAPRGSPPRDRFWAVREARLAGGQHPPRPRLPRGGVGALGATLRDTQSDVPSAWWLRAQLAFKDSMVHGILQFTPSIAFRYVLHRCESRDIRCRESFCVVSGSPPGHRFRAARELALRFGFLGASGAGCCCCCAGGSGLPPAPGRPGRPLGRPRPPPVE